MDNQVYVANYATVEIFDMPEPPNFEFDACPQFFGIYTRLSQEWLQKCKDELLDNLNYTLDLEDSEEVPRWETDGWRELPIEEGRSNQVWDIYVGTEMVARMVVQRVQLGD